MRNLFVAFLAVVAIGCTTPEQHRYGDLSPSGVTNGNVGFVGGLTDAGGVATPQVATVDPQGNLHVSITNFPNPFANGQCNLDGGGGNQCTLFLPALVPSSTVVASLANPITGQYGCSAVTEAPGGDSGVVVIQCGGAAATLGADGGQANWVRLN
jgi:hypothetical protein